MPDSSNADSLSMAQLSLEDRSALEQRAMRAEKEAETLREAFSQYKDMVRQTFYEDKAATLPPTAESPTPSSSSTIVDGSAPTWDMDYYFESYSELEIHESMLKDAARTEAYRDALYHNKDFFKGKVVLDVGCGTGILSMFAARAGASQVYSVDNATIINKARQIVTANGLDDIITFVPGQVEQVTLPVDKVDVIISEWMGYFLLFEGMFDSVIAARDRWLAPDGIMAPSRMTMLVGAFQDSEYVNDRYHFWKNVYGFDMSAMKGFLLRDAQVDYAHAESLVSVPQVVKEIDTKTSTVPQLDFLTELSLEIMSEEALLHGLIGWFDTYFEGPDAFETILLSTGPAATPTHWKQCLFLFETPLEVTKGIYFIYVSNVLYVINGMIPGSLIKGTFECVKSLECHRELIVKVNVYVEGNEKTRIQQTYRVRW